MLVDTAIRPFYKADCGITEIAIDAGYEPQVWSSLQWLYVAFNNHSRLVGYYWWSNHNSERGGHVEIEQFAVAKDSRRLGVGTDMMNRFVGQVSSWPVAKIVVPECALEGQLFLKATGWKCVTMSGGKMVFNRSLPQ